MSETREEKVERTIRAMSSVVSRIEEAQRSGFDANATEYWKIISALSEENLDELYEKLVEAKKGMPALEAAARTFENYI